jgi:xylulose-5-phosphate/fructose-6-phosphate phosphoketolase
MVAGKHPSPQWLSMDEVKVHCKLGQRAWEWASNDHGHSPDVFMAFAGDVPTLEALAAMLILRKSLPKLCVHFINVVNLMKLFKPKEYEWGISHDDFDSLFTKDKPVVFNFHGYPHLIHELIFGRNNQIFSAKGYIEEGRNCILCLMFASILVTVNISFLTSIICL